MSRRRGRPGPPPPRRQGQGGRPLSRAGGRQAAASKEQLEQAIRSIVRRSGGEILELTPRQVQRRGSDRSHIYGARVRQGERVLRTTLVAFTTSRRVPGGLVPVVVGGHRIFVWRYPADPFLPGLPRVTSNRRVRELFDELRIIDGQPSLTRRVYRATRRAVIQADLLEDDESVRDTVWVKVMGDRKHARITERTNALGQLHLDLAEHLPVPTVLGIVPEDGILCTAHVPGSTLRKAILDGEPTPPATDIAAITLTLAQLDLDTDADPPRYADPTRHAATIGQVLPKEAARVRGLVEAAQVTGPLVTVHGDFHDGQVLVEDGKLSGLLDIDGVGKGHLASDAGRMIAYVESIGDLARADEATVEAWIGALRAAYEDHVEEDNLARAVGAAWVALATGPHRRQQKRWQELTSRRLDHAERWLRDAGAL